MTDLELAQDLEECRAEAMRAGDADSLDRMFDDELVYTHSFGNRDSKAEFMDKFRRGVFVYHELRNSVARVFRRGDVLIVTGAMWSRATVAGEDRIIDNVATVVWAEEEGGWKLVAFAPTPLKH